MSGYCEYCGNTICLCSEINAEIIENKPNTMKINRIWAMPNKWTFSIPPIKRLLKETADDYSRWVDPFAGMNSPAGFTNDIRTEMPALYHKDALEFLKELPGAAYDGALYDPPYSIYQAKECYESAGMKNLAGCMSWWSNTKNELARIIKPGGKAICFGWSSNGLGKSRGFTMQQVLVVPHGGSKNDTLVTVETKDLPHADLFKSNEIEDQEGT